MAWSLLTGILASLLALAQTGRRTRERRCSIPSGGATRGSVRKCIRRARQPNAESDPRAFPHCRRHDYTGNHLLLKAARTKFPVPCCLMSHGRSMENFLPTLKIAVGQFIDELRAEEEVGVYTFTTSLRVIQPFTSDKKLSEAGSPAYTRRRWYGPVRCRFQCCWRS